MTLADIGYNASFGIEGTTLGTYVEMAEVKALTPLGFNREKQDATHLKSPDAFKEYVMSLFDTEDASITLNFTPANFAAMWAAFHAPDGGNYQFTFPDGQQMRFTGAFASMSLPEMTPEGLMQSSGSITRTTGKPTLHAAAGVVPVNSVLPAISGIAQEGETLTAFAGIWSGGPTFAFQWQEFITDAWVNISGATSQTLVVPGGSTIGRAVRVVVTASNAAGSATANSVQTAAVIAE